LIIQLESIGQYAVNNEPSVMPYLQSLQKNNLTIPYFYATSCETINAEYTSLCSFWPDSIDPVNYKNKDNQFYCLPEILKNEHGYDTYFFHANTADFWDRDLLTAKFGFASKYFVPKTR
jgi:lipoteichoic acid synthase